MKRVFLGGTCNDDKWRDELIPMLAINYFNPVVDTWTPERLMEEINKRQVCDYVLYVITPRMEGVYSIAEAVDDSNKRPDSTLFCWLEKESPAWSAKQRKSLYAVQALIAANKAHVFESLQDIAIFLNKQP